MNILVGFTVKIKDHDITLTMDEARELYAELGKVFNPPRAAAMRGLGMPTESKAGVVTTKPSGGPPSRPSPPPVGHA